jgi:hypothetical protein
MMIFLLLAAVALPGILVALARAIAGDGYGVRPPPRSHREEVDDAWSSDHPSAAWTFDRSAGLS